MFPLSPVNTSHELHGSFIARQQHAVNFLRVDHGQEQMIFVGWVILMESYPILLESAGFARNGMGF
jgi:hypothetical protein